MVGSVLSSGLIRAAKSLKSSSSGMVGIPIIRSPLNSMTANDPMIEFKCMVLCCRRSASEFSLEKRLCIDEERFKVDGDRLHISVKSNLKLMEIDFIYQ